MRKGLLFIPAFLASLGVAAPASDLKQLLQRDDNDPDDVSFIKKIAAIGDSYSAGIGAGERLGRPLDPNTFGDWKCSRYDKSYPAQINKALFYDQKDKFQFHSCSGALVQDVINDQVKLLDKDQDVVLLSAGGNDAELVWILNHCVYQFFSPTPAASKALETTLEELTIEQPEVAILLAFYREHKEKFERSCDQQLKISEGILHSKEFTDRMGVLIEKAQEKLRKDSGAIYYTGYAKFWDTNMADNDYCSKNENSWSFFYNINEPTKVISDRAFLTKDRRQKMNDLVELANKKIKETVEKKDKKNSKGQSNTVFVDFDGYFGDVDGRFCTKGADKPETDRKDEVTFYPLNIWDPMGSGDFKRDEPVEVYNGTFEGQVDSFAALADYSGVHYRTNIPMAKGKAKAKMLAAEPGTPKADVAVAAAGDKVALQKRFSILPDGFGRVFHPTMAGHQIMARLVLYKIAQRNAAGLKKDYGQEVLTIAASDSCPVDTKIPAFEARCTGDDGSASGLPTNVFENYQKGTNVYDEFCKQMDDRKLDYKKPQSWKVNAKGEKQSGSSKVRRTPPPDADAHKQMISMKWTPSTSGECKQSCKDAFKGMARGCGGKGGSLNIMAVRARYNTGCGTFSYEITGDGVPDKAAQCTQAQVKAPKRDRDVTGKGTSVEKAYTQFCEEYDGKTLEDSSTLDRKYKRYGVSSWGVENRVSFWISASFIKGCTGKVTIKKDTCMKKFKGGLDSCDKDNGFSGGFTADEQCIQYLVETGYELRDDGGRWNVNNLPAAYPPPEDTDGIKLKCLAGQPTRQISEDELNRSINAFCKNGADIKGFGKYSENMIDYPPKGETQFYPNDRLTYHLTFGASTVNQGEPNPYKDMGWCKNYDWKLVEDDCRFVMRKGYNECKTAKGEWKGFEYVYRCVKFRSFGINMGK